MVGLDILSPEAKVVVVTVPLEKCHYSSGCNFAIFPIISKSHSELSFGMVKCKRDKGILMKLQKVIMSYTQSVYIQPSSHYPYDLELSVSRDSPGG